MSTRYVIALLSIFFSTLAISQNRLDNTVILYNLIPLRVDLDTDGSIKQMYGTDYKYLRGYTVVRPKLESKVALTSITSDQQGYYVVSTKTHDIMFNSLNATLSQDALENLDETSQTAFFDGHRILIHPYLTDESNVAKTLLKNRINAVLMYLELKGYGKDKVVISVDPIHNNSNTIQLSFIK